MTLLLERAISEASRLPEPEQDALASLLLEEIASETRWSAAFADSQAQLARLAADALAEFHAGRTLPLDPERDLADHHANARRSVLPSSSLKQVENPCKSVVHEQSRRY